MIEFRDESEKRLFFMSGAVVVLVIISMILLVAHLTIVFFVLAALTILFALYTAYKISKQEPTPAKQQAKPGRRQR